MRYGLGQLADDTAASEEQPPPSQQRLPPVFAERLGAFCGVPKSSTGEAAMYVFLPLASGWACYTGEQPDETDGQFRMPCTCLSPLDVDAFGAAKLGLVAAAAIFLAVVSLGLILDAMLRERRQRAYGRRRAGHNMAHGMPHGANGFGIGPRWGSEQPPMLRTWEELYGLNGEVEPVAAKIDLTVAAARDLPPMDSNVLTAIGVQKASSDPYVRVEFGTRRHCTTTKDDTLFPVWEETFQLEAKSQLPCCQALSSFCCPWCAVAQMRPDEAVILSVYDRDMFSADDAMGEVQISLGEILQGPVAESWRLLMPTAESIVAAAEASTERRPIDAQTLGMRGQLCVRWDVDVSFAAGGAWKCRAFGYLTLQVAHLVAFCGTLVHLVQHGCE